MTAAVVAHTAPYPWPYDGALDGDRLALVVAGADEHWVARSCDPVAVAERLAALAVTIRSVGGVVVHVAHDRPARAPGTGPTRLDPVALRFPGDLLVVAGGIDGFFGSPLDARLRAAGRDQLVVGGFGLEGPVHSTMRSANDAGYECLLLTDASAPLSPFVPAVVEAAHSMVTMSGGIFGALGTTTDLAAALGPDR